MEQSISSTTSLSSDQVPTMDLESAPAVATVAQPANALGPDNEKELESKDTESDVGAWLCVFASLLFLTSSYGFMNSLGTIQSYLTHNELSDYTVSQVGWISGIYLFLSLIFNFQIGAILDRYGPQILSPIAAAFSTVTFLLLAECKEYWHFILCLGLFGSIGSSIGAVTAIGVVGKLFTRRRGLAMGLAVMGTSLGGIIYPMMLRATFGKLGWAWSMRLVALVIACLTSLGVLCFLPFRRLTEGRRDVQQPQGLSLDLSAFKSLKFVITAFGICMVEFVNYGISGLLPTIATGAGFSVEDGYTLLSILGACSCLGRFSIGFVGDKVGPFNAVVSTMLVIVILLSTVFIPFSTTSAPLMYVFTALWGYCSGSFYVLSPLCTGKTCKPNDYARYFGSTNMCVAVALLLANPLSGILLEKLGAQLLGCFYLAIIILAGISLGIARGLLLKKWFVLREKM
ncbi:Ff.00g113750.m01.CDS01 [Fusarium sp. VM40]|nr:Ff.00g113750.m01.CDS01 [Fusarium sp. VM40]